MGFFQLITLKVGCCSASHEQGLAMMSIVVFVFVIGDWLNHTRSGFRHHLCMTGSCMVGQVKFTTRPGPADSAVWHRQRWWTEVCVQFKVWLIPNLCVCACSHSVLFYGLLWNKKHKLCKFCSGQLSLDELSAAKLATSSMRCAQRQ